MLISTWCLLNYLNRSFNFKISIISQWHKLIESDSWASQLLVCSAQVTSDYIPVCSILIIFSVIIKLLQVILRKLLWVFSWLKTYLLNHICTRCIIEFVNSNRIEYFPNFPITWIIKQIMLLLYCLF